MEWAFVWLFVVLKVPLLAALWIIWWSVREQPAGTGEERPGGGGWGRSHPRPPRPRPPRRGPHGDPSARAPKRVRARARRLAPARR